MKNYKFIKRHPAGIEEGSIKPLEARHAARLIKGGYIEETDEAPKDEKPAPVEAPIEEGQGVEKKNKKTKKD